MSWKFSILLFVTVLAVARAQQPSGDPPAQSKCVVEGTATDALTGEPLRKATVRLNLQVVGGVGYTSTTDLSGHFHLEGITAGDYALYGERAGYLTAVLKKLHLQAGEKLSNLQLELMRHSVIRGKVLDENGEPVSKGWVNAYSSFWMHGARQYGFRGQGQLNDAGEYQITGLAPGRYYLYVDSGRERFVEQQGGPERALLPSFYPESQTFKSAAPVQVDAGQDLTGINFRLHTGTVFHIRGKVDMGDLAKQRERLAIEAAEHGVTWEIRDLDSGIEKDGSFDITDVPPGSYDLELMDEIRHLSIATIPIEVKTSDVNGIHFVSPGHLQLKGAVKILGAEGSTFSAMEVRANDLRGMMGQPYIAPVRTDGTFELQDVWPGKYFVSVSTKDREEYVKSILYGGEEVLGVPLDLALNAGASLEVILAKGAGQVEGTVQLPGDEKRSDCDVILISARERLDNAGILAALPDQNGHFSFKGVPPGRYYALAASNVEWDLWQNPDFASQLRDNGLEVDLPESGHVHIQVPVVAKADVERAIANLPL